MSSGVGRVGALQGYVELGGGQGLRLGESGFGGGGVVRSEEGEA